MRFAIKSVRKYVILFRQLLEQFFETLLVITEIFKNSIFHYFFSSHCITYVHNKIADLPSKQHQFRKFCNIIIRNRFITFVDVFRYPLAISLYLAIGLLQGPVLSCLSLFGRVRCSALETSIMEFLTSVISRILSLVTRSLFDFPAALLQ